MKRVWILSAMLLVGCTSQMTVPEPFVRLDNPGLYDTKAISADGVTIAARRIDVPADSTLAFWTRAVTDELVAQGYRQDDAEDVTAARQGSRQAAGGQEGKLLWFSRELDGRRYTYVTALFPTAAGQVLLAEAGGPADAFEEHRAAVREALLSVR